jgi:DNA-binding MarR family transcriptional regulator
VQGHRRTIEELLWALKPFASLRGGITLRYVTAFLAVALDEGKGQNFYAREIGMHRASMSRCLRDISQKGRGGRQGLGLIRIEDHPGNVQRRKVFLTDEGRALLALITRPFHSGPLMRAEERKLIATRTKAAIATADKRAAVAFGGPEVRERQRIAVKAIKERADQRAATVLPIIREAQSAGATSLHQLAAALNLRGITTPRGGQWYAKAVSNLLARASRG